MLFFIRYLFSRDKNAPNISVAEGVVSNHYRLKEFEYSEELKSTRKQLIFSSLALLFLGTMEPNNSIQISLLIISGETQKGLFLFLIALTICLYNLYLYHHHKQSSLLVIDKVPLINLWGVTKETTKLLAKANADSIIHEIIRKTTYKQIPRGNRPEIRIEENNDFKILACVSVDNSHKEIIENLRSDSRLSDKNVFNKGLSIRFRYTHNLSLREEYFISLQHRLYTSMRRENRLYLQTPTYLAIASIICSWQWVMETIFTLIRWIQASS